MSRNVTILIPVYNGMPYLPGAVKSVMDQTLRGWRCVIVNDGSTDGTREFLESIHDDRFTILHQENAGISAAINHGLKHCDTPYIARLDADDIALPTRFAEQAAYLDAHSDVGLLGTQVAPLGDRSSGRSLQLPVDHDAIFRALLNGRHAMVHSAVMGRTALIKQIGGYWPLPIGEEFDLMLRLGEVSRLANLDGVLVLWRVHEHSLTGSQMRMNRFYIGFACESARRRQAGESPLTLAEYRTQCDSRPWWRRWQETFDLHARCQYRVALAEIYGGRPAWGVGRMAWAALCSPRLTIERIARTVRHSRARAEANCESPSPDGQAIAIPTHG